MNTDNGHGQLTWTVNTDSEHGQWSRILAGKGDSKTENSRAGGQVPGNALTSSMAMSPCHPPTTPLKAIFVFLAPAGMEPEVRCTWPNFQSLP